MARFGRILLVENDAEYSEMIKAMLRKRDPECNIVHALDGVEAMTIMSQGYRPDLIISDKKMPRMNGQELLVAVKTNKKLSSIPFFILPSNNCMIELTSYGERPGAPQSKLPGMIRDVDMLILRMIRNVADA